MDSLWGAHLRNSNKRKADRMCHIILLLAMVAAILPVDVLAVYDYCNVKQCKNHIACDNEGDLSDDCPEIVDIVKMSDYSDIIVKWYNRLRDRVASGRTHLKPAARMGAMAWDDELANLAEMNVKRCRMGLDKCHPTAEYVYSGQNTGQFEWSGADFMELHLLQQRTHVWMKGLPNVTMDVIRKFTVKKNPAIGRITVMINESNNRIGCAAVIMTVREDTKRFILTCNYATTNLINERVYTPGKPALKCKKRHKVYRSLCSVAEVYKNNKF